MAIGVDTHKASLAACAIDEAGRLVGERSFDDSAVGHRAYRDLELLVDYRDQLIAEQTRLRNRPHSDLRVLMPGYGAQLGRLGNLRHATSLPAARSPLAPLDGVAVELTELRLARLEALASEIAETKRRLDVALASEHPALATICGVGPLTAARLPSRPPQARRSACASTGAAIVS